MGKGTLELNNITYEVVEDKDNYHFKDTSNSETKVHFSFSKNIDKNNQAKQGLKKFWSEVLT